MSNTKKPRSYSATKSRVPPLAPPQPPPPPIGSDKKLDLDRSTKITKNENGEIKEYVVNFDELETGDLLGRGQFGTVKRMYHPQSNLTFAVKMISDNYVESNASIDKRNSDLMDLQAPLKIGDGCPYLLKFYGALHAESYIWILTEVMDTSIDRFYVKTFALNLPMPELFISKVAHCVVSGLDYMKKLKLMHRDIKPSNILINATGEIKVCDFGISGFMTNSVCKTFKGCQKYMPPEKIDPSLSGQGYSIKADIWSLGVSLIEIAQGSHPFNDAKGFLGLIKSIVTEEPPKLDSSKFGAELCTFVNKCLIKKAEERGSCSDLLKEPFIVNHLDKQLDVEFVTRVIDEIKKDKIE